MNSTPNDQPMGYLVSIQSPIKWNIIIPNPTYISLKEFTPNTPPKTPSYNLISHKYPASIPIPTNEASSHSLTNYYPQKQILPIIFRHSQIYFHSRKIGRKLFSISPNFFERKDPSEIIHRFPIDFLQHIYLSQAHRELPRHTQIRHRHQSQRKRTLASAPMYSVLNVPLLGEHTYTHRGGHVETGRQVNVFETT